jgi:hypothetical protein
MKTQIIQLEHHDDIVSTCDKMNWARGGRILLVWPEDRPMLNRRLDLTLIKRRAAALGAPLALVSKDPEVRYYGPRLGIPVFLTLRKAQDANWRLPRRFRQPSLVANPAEAAVEQEKPALARPERPAPNTDALEALALTPTARLAFFALGVLAMLAIAAVLLPSATVEVAPQTQVQDALIDLYAAPEVKRVDIGGSVPARWISVTVEGRDTLPAGGTINIPEQAASGAIVFTNLTEQDVNLPAGTVALTEGEAPVRFAVTRAGRIPGGPGQSLTLPAEALEPGERGNLSANRLTAIEGPVGAQVSASNPQPMRGGLSQAIPAPSEEDRRALTTRLTAALEATALQELGRRLGDDDVLIPSSLERVQTVEESAQPRLGLPAERLTLSLRLEYRALAVSGSDLRTLAQTVFDANLPPEAVALNDSLRIENLGAPVSAWPGYSWQVHAYRQIAAQLPEARVIQSVLGRSSRQAAQTLAAQLRMDEPARIALQPAWWPRLPVLPFRIQVVYAYSGR